MQSITVMNLGSVRDNRVLKSFYELFPDSVGDASFGREKCES